MVANEKNIYMIFGLFENKQGQAMREETANTIAEADSLEKKDKKNCKICIIKNYGIYERNRRSA